LFAWLGTTTGGIFLFLFLTRRRSRGNAPSLATFVFESPAPVAPRPSMPPPQPPVSDDAPVAAMAATMAAAPSMRSRAKKGKAQASTPSADGFVSAFARPAAKGVERVFVSYQGVPMVAAPYEVRPMLARLERGNEIEIIGSHEGYLNVRTPEGLTGWIQRGTVSNVRPKAPTPRPPALN
jgi:hypothetical protein